MIDRLNIELVTKFGTDIEYHGIRQDTAWLCLSRVTCLFFWLFY